MTRECEFKRRGVRCDKDATDLLCVEVDDAKTLYGRCSYHAYCPKHIGLAQRIVSDVVLIAGRSTKVRATIVRPA